MSLTIRDDRLALEPIPTTTKRAEAYKLPLWLRLTLAIALALVIAWSLMIYLTYTQRRAGSIAQAHDFAETVTQMTVATITGLMITNTVDKRAVFLDQMKNSNNIRDLKVFRHRTVIEQYGAGQGGESDASAVEREVMDSGQPRFEMLDGEQELRAVVPILNWSNYLGKNCMSCHHGREGLVLGAVSMRVSLQKTQAELRDFTWNIAWLAVGLSIPLLAAIFVLVRRYVVRPLGGEPSDAAQVANRIADGDLAAPVPLEPGDRSSLMASMASMQDQLSGLIGQVNDSARVIASGTGEVAAGAQNLSQRTEEQATSLEETASALEQITTAVMRNSEHAQQAAEIAQQAASVAARGGQTIDGAVMAMASVTETARKVADIVAAIDAIAFQTNILALNAAVEAARAGHEGSGFAVVASEVRALSQRCAVAAKEIRELIEQSTREVVDGKRMVDEAGRIMQEVVDSVKGVTTLMGDIADASRQQRAGIEEVNKAVTQIDQVTQQNAALVEEAAAAAESLKQQADAMTQAVAVFRLA